MADDQPPLIEFIPAGTLDLNPPSEVEVTEVTLVREDWEERMDRLAHTPGTTVRVKRAPNLKREQVVFACLDAFELIGGSPRLALWADENPGEFFKLWSKLAPKQIEQETQIEGGIRIQHVLPRGALDQ